MCILEIGPELISSLYSSILSFDFGDFVCVCVCVCVGGGGGGGHFAEFQQRVKIVGL